MKDFSQIDLGATILSVAIAAGFLAFAFLVFRVLVIGISAAINRMKEGSPSSGDTEPTETKGFESGDDK